MELNLVSKGNISMKPGLTISEIQQLLNITFLNESRERYEQVRMEIFEQLKKEKRLIVFHLKEKWFRMYQNGEKTEEYREPIEKWSLYISKHGYQLRLQDGIVAELDLAYPKKDDFSRKLFFQIENFTVGFGDMRLGAELGKVYYITKMGRRLLV